MGVNFSQRASDFYFNYSKVRHEVCNNFLLAERVKIDVYPERLQNQFSISDHSVRYFHRPISSRGVRIRVFNHRLEI